MLLTVLEDSSAYLPILVNIPE